MTVPAALRRALATVAVCTAACAAIALPTPAPAAEAASATSVTVVPGGDGILAPGSKLQVAVTVQAGSATPAGDLRLSIDPTESPDAQALAERVSSTYVNGYAIGNASVPALAAGATTTLSITVAASILTEMLGDEAGGYALDAAFWSSGDRIALGSTAISWIPTGFARSVTVTTVVPLTAPATSTGLVDSDTIEALTSPGGEWDSTVRAVQDTHATIALDPEIPASVRALGAAADANGFLDELSGLSNEVLRLPYGDGDVELQRAAGATSVLEPTSFAGSLVTTPPTSTPTPPADAATGSATAGSTPTASPTATAQSTDPAQVTAWNYSVSSVAWPTSGGADAADLAFLKKSGYSSAIVSGADVNDTAARRAAGPLATVKGGSVLVSDQTISSLVARASAGDDASARSARSTLIASLAADAAGGTVTSVLDTVSRDSSSTPALDHVLRLIERQSWIRHGTVAGLLDATSRASVQLRTPAADARTASATALVTGEAGVRELGRAISEPETITGPERLVLLGLMSSAWEGETSAWQRAAASGVTRFTRIVESVHLDRKSTVNYVGGSGAINFSVVNNLTRPVTIVLHGDPNNGRLLVEGTTTATIPAESSGTVKLPVRSISNGSVQVTLSITTPDGWVIGATSVAQINVNAGWETIAAVVFIVGIVGLFALGFYRNVIRRRRMIRKRAERAARG